MNASVNIAMNVGPINEREDEKYNLEILKIMFELM